MNTRVLFIVSLPRSGSTLLQKMLVANNDVASNAEPWIMLPFWGMRQVSVGRSAYFHHTTANAINDFIGSIPSGEDMWATAVGEYAISLYAAAAAGKSVFLDKTPRYYLLLPLIRRALPESHIILLLRNPLSVLASICETFNRGRFMWFEYWLDWIEGHRCLARAVREGGAATSVLHYEDLVSKPASVLTTLCAQIGIPYNTNMITGYRSTELKGRMGDPVGFHSYAAVTTDSLDKWQNFFNSGYRRRIAEQMLALIASEDLDTLGYPLQALLEALHERRPRRGLDMRSRFEHTVGSIAHWIDFRYLQARLRARASGDKYAYGFYRKM